MNSQQQHERLRIRNLECIIRPLAGAEIPCVDSDICPVLLIEDQQRISPGWRLDGRNAEVRARKGFARDRKGVFVQDLRVFGVEADVVSANAAVIELRVEVVCVPERCVGHDVGDDHRRIDPFPGRMRRRGRLGDVQILPTQVDFVVEIDRHDIRYGARSPREATHAGVAVGGEVILPIPLGGVVGPVDFLEYVALASVPEMNPNDRIWRSVVPSSPRNRAVGELQSNAS